MSKLAAAVIGAGVATGIGVTIWQVRKAIAKRKAEEEAAKQPEPPEPGQLAEAPAPPAASSPPAAPPAVQPAPPAVQTTPPTASSPPVAPPAPSPKPDAPASGSSLDLIQQLATKYSEPTPQTAPQSKPAPIDPKKWRKQRHKPITQSTHDKTTGHVHQTPAALLEQARRAVPDLTLTEYTAARMIASEHFSGTPTEWAAILDAELNRAPKNLDKLTEHIAPWGIYGYQGRGKRKVATTRDPAFVHIEIARRVLSGELRGISKGARRFFDPISQAAAHRKWASGKSKRQHCKPAVILERWSFGYDWDKAAECTLNRSKSKSKQEWVGPIEGIDPRRLMLLRRSRGGAQHQQQYEAALSILRKAGLA